MIYLSDELNDGPDLDGLFVQMDMDVCMYNISLLGFVRDLKCSM